MRQHTPKSPTWLGALLALSLAAPAWAQAPPTTAPGTPGAAPATTTAGPPARYVGREGLGLYFEFAGVDAYPDAWAQTAASKILNETTTGAMLEDVFAQLNDRSKVPNKVLNGKEQVQVTEHIFHKGMVQAANAAAGGTPRGTTVFRAAASTKELRALFAKVMRQAAKPGATMSVAVKGSRRIVMVDETKAGGKQWAWWPEGGDLIRVDGDPAAVDAALAVIDGKAPNAVDEPRIAELFRAEEGFQPIAVGFYDRATLGGAPSLAQLGGAVPPGALDSARKSGLEAVERADLRWGARGKELQTIARIAAPAPRQGVLALFDQPTFDAESLPPLPKGLDGFTVFSVDAAGAYDRLREAAKAGPPGPLQGGLDHMDEYLQQKAHVKLRDDLLARLGPKMAAFVVPGKKPAAGGNPLAALGLQVPRFVLMIEMTDREAVRKATDNLMIEANKALRTTFTPPADKDDKEKEKKDAPKVAAPEFRPSMSDPKHKLWILSLPPQLGSMTNARPSLLIGDKYLIIATVPDVARQVAALEKSSKDRYQPPSDLAQAMTDAGGKLMFLRISDPTDTLPQALAEMPATAQALVQLATNQPPPPPGGPGGGPPGGSSASARRGGPMSAAPAGGSPPPELSSSGSSSGSSGGPSSGPGGPGAGPNGGDAGGPITVDPAKIPAPDAIKKYLFPGLVTVSADESEVRITTRAAFPAALGSLKGLVQGLQMARGMAAGGAPGLPPGIPGAPGRPGQPGSSGGGPPQSRSARD